MDDNPWAPPDPSHRMTHDTDHQTIARIRRAFRRQQHERLATTRGRHDTRIIVALTIAGTVMTWMLSDSTQDTTLEVPRQDLVPTVVDRP